MKLKKILLAASALSFAATSAHAINFETNDTTMPASLPGISALTAAAGGVPAFQTNNPAVVNTLANELNFAAAPLVSVDGAAAGLAFQVELTDESATFPDGQNLLVTVELPAGLTWGTTVSAAAVLAGNDDSSAVGTVTAADIVSTTISVTAGGGASDNTVSFLYGVQGTTDESIGFYLPVRVNSCPATGAMISVSITTESGTALETGGAAMAAPGISCVDGFDAAIVTDFPVTAFVAPSPFVASNPTAANTQIALPAYDSLTGGTVLGRALININAAASSVLGTTATALTAADVVDLEFDVEFVAPAGLDSVSLAAISGAPTLSGAQVIDRTVLTTPVPTDVPNTVVDLNVNPTATGVSAADISVSDATGTSNAVILAQNVNVTNAVLDLAAAFVDVTLSDSALDTLDRAGTNAGPYDWNNENGAVNSVYRITGLSTTTDTPLVVTYSNSRGGAAFNTAVSSTIAAADVTNGEYVITSRGGLSTMNAGYDRADVSFFFEAPGIDVDRLISSSGIVGNFGNAANGDD